MSNLILVLVMLKAILGMPITLALAWTIFFIIGMGLGFCELD